MAEYCDWSDMPVESCQHCKDGKKIVQTRRQHDYSGETRSETTHSGPSRAFRAKYDGTCRECGFAIAVDESVMYDAKGRLVHVGCVD